MTLALDCQEECNGKSSGGINEYLSTIEIVLLAGVVLMVIAIAGCMVLLASIFRKTHAALHKREEGDGKGISLQQTTETPRGSGLTARVPILKSSSNYAPPQTITLQGFRHEIREKWSRPLEKLSVYIDIPRLVSSIEVVENGVVKWAPNLIQGTDRREKLIIDFLSMLAGVVESKKLARSIQDASEQYFPTGEEVDISRRLQQLIPPVIGEESKVIRILKACTQSMVASAVLRLKYQIGNYFPFSDAYKGWTIRIEVNVHHVRILHQKWEKSNGDEIFTFKWEFEILLDLSANELISANLLITDIIFATEDDDTKNALKYTMEPFLSSGATIKQS